MTEGQCPPWLAEWTSRSSERMSDRQCCHTVPRSTAGMALCKCDLSLTVTLLLPQPGKDRHICLKNVQIYSSLTQKSHFTQCSWHLCFFRYRNPVQHLTPLSSKRIQNAIRKSRQELLAWMWHVLISAVQTPRTPTLSVFMVTLSSLEQKPCPSHLSKPAITPPQFHIILPCQVHELQR